MNVRLNHHAFFSPVFYLLLLLPALLPGRVSAQVAKQGHTALDSLAFSSVRLTAADSLETIDNVQGLMAAGVAGHWASFRLNAGGDWNALVDKRTGRVEIAEGAGIPWIPGTGNELSRAAFPRVDLASMDGIARAFMPKVAGLLGINPANLVINKGRSGQPADYLWFVDYDVVTAAGQPIEGARVVFRVNHGNLVQFGTENMPAPGAVLPSANVKRDVALANAARSIGGFGSADTFLDGGSLHVMSTGLIDNRFADGFQFANGRGLSQVWQFTFHRDGVLGTWRTRVDASTGEVLELADVNDYATAQATGGIYQNSPTTGSETVMPMPFANLSSGGFTSSAGIYSNTTAATSTLAGKYVRIADTCGSISQASDTSGNILFGTSTGTDCTTPGHGGAGNTHASREQFYQVNRIQEAGRGWLPANTWLGAQITVNVNLNRVCNAYWNGSTLNFFKSGGGCGNTGEIAGVSLHEYGHGLDQNDGTGTAPEGGTGEAYADITAAIALHTSCIGPGFTTGNCSGYGNACTSCTGVRDIDFAKHSTGLPATVANHTQAHCSSGAGPCGREVHCESYVPSEAVWDFANRDLPGAGTGPAWTILDRLWYLSRSTATSSFTCHTGSTFTSDGCGTGNWWKTMRAVDDDDGNLANGTPHGGALFAAFNRHGVACATDAGAGTTFSGCTPPAAPTVTATPGNNSIGLIWTVSGSAVYDVFRNESGCDAGFTKIANDNATASLTDNAVANGLTYFYQAVAQPAGNEACGSAPSPCVSVTPAATYLTIAASPATISVAPGNAGISTISTAISGGFNSSIALSASGQPTGLTVTFSPPYIAAPGAGSSTATFSVATSTATGTYPVIITGTGGGVTRTATVILTVSGVSSFVIGATPSTVVAMQGNAGSSAVITAVSGGFNNAVALSASGQPAGITVSFSPASIAAPGAGATAATFTVDASMVPGTYLITVSGTGGSITRTATVTLIVYAVPTFTLSASPAAITVMGGSTGTATVSAVVSGFTGNISVWATGQPSGVNVSFNPSNIPAQGPGISTATFSVATATSAGTYPITIHGNTGSTGGGTRTTTVLLTVLPVPSFTLDAAPTALSVMKGSAGIATISTRISGGLNSAIALSASGQPTGVTVSFIPASIAAPGAGSSTATFSVAATTAAGTYTVTIAGNAGNAGNTGTDGGTHTTTLALTVTAVPDFTLAAAPAALSVAQGNTGSANINTTVSGGFYNSVALSASGQPAGVTIYLSPLYIAAQGAGSSLTTFYAGPATAPGTYPITVTATGGGVTHTVTVTLTVTEAPRFILAASPSAITVAKGSTGTSTLITAIAGGFNSYIVFWTYGLPSGVTVSFSLNPIAAPGAGFSTATFSVAASTAAGTYPVTISAAAANNGGHSAIIILTVPPQ